MGQTWFTVPLCQLCEHKAGVCRKLAPITHIKCLIENKIDYILKRVEPELSVGTKVVGYLTVKWPL